MRAALLFLLATASVLAGCASDLPTTPGDGGLPPGDDGGTPPPASGYVDPACTDGRYNEAPLPDPSASLDGIGWSGEVGPVVDEALARRHPFGAEQVTAGRLNRDYGGDCDVLFAGSPASAGDVFRALDTIVHECGHFHDGTLSDFSSNGYAVRSGLTVTCDRGDAVGRGGDTFARSRIREDAYQPLRPACGTGECDFYADTYLDGDPDDGTFDGGDQGFNMLLEETVQYVSSLATAYAFADQLPPGRSTSARDGILTFLWYVERYLKLARESYPEAYARISGDACWRDLILTVWGRAWLYLELTRDMGSLGIDDDAIEALVADPVLLDEIERLRALSGCP